jgi:hypothetical protein
MYVCFSNTGTVLALEVDQLLLNLRLP